MSGGRKDPGKFKKLKKSIFVTSLYINAKVVKDEAIEVNRVRNLVTRFNF